MLVVGEVVGEFVAEVVGAVLVGAVGSIEKCSCEFACTKACDAVPTSSATLL